MAPEGVELRLRRSLEFRGSLELQNGGFRALEETSMMIFRLRRFPPSLCVFRGVLAAPGGAELRPERFQEVRGSLGSPERWPEGVSGAWITTF